MDDRIPRELAVELLEEIGPVVTYCRVFAVGPPCATPCESCRRTSRDLHRAAAREEDT